MVKLGRHGGALLTGCVVAMLVGSQTAAAQTTTLPSGWANGDVGNPVVPGSAQGSAGTYTVQGAGADIGGTSDQFQYCYRSISGDLDIRVRIDALQDTSPGSKFGLMVRDSMNASAKNVFVLLSAEQKLALQWRTKAGRATGMATGATAAAPVWIRLTRQGSTFRGYWSATGSGWTLIGTTDFRMSSNAYVGLAVTSHSPYQPATGMFSGLTTGTTVPALPSPWTAKDIGNPTMAGAANENGGTFTLSGAGTDIFNSSDQFQFVYQPVTGDTQIVARVASLQAANTGSKAGAMIRADLTASAANASVFATAGTWISQQRLLAGGTTYQTTGSAGAAPGWVRVVREGDVLRTFESPDGSSWTLIDTDTVPMPSTVYVGLAVTSHTATALATATFTDVTVSAPPSSNDPPAVSITAPGSGATFTAPAGISIAAAAGDTDGSITRVDFYAGAQLVGSDTTSPFTATWSSVPAGTYNLTAVATDNLGAETTSAPISVTVTAVAPPPLPTEVVFVPGADYSTNATSVTVELRRASDAVTVTPVASRNLGKPAVVSGEISMDISTLVDPLAAGSYYAIIVTTGAGGSAPSSPSATFTK